MDSYSLQPQNQKRNTFGPPAQLYLPPKDNKKKALIITLCVCAVILAAVLVGWISYVNSPSYRVSRGFMKLARELEEMKNPLSENLGAGELRRNFVTEGIHADTRLDVTVDTYLGEITLGVDTLCEQDRRAKELSAETALSLMNYEFGHVMLYGNDEKLCFSVPELFLENLYIENEDVKGQYNRSVWADVFGPASGDDLSIQLFPEAWIFGQEESAADAFCKAYADELAECGRHMRIEKAGKDIYRVSFDELYLNELIRQVLYDYVDFTTIGREQAMGMLSYFDVISEADEISFMLEINGKNRIECIRTERPLPLCKGEMSFYGEVYFLGGERSIEKIQGKIEAKDGAQEAEILWQMTQSLKQDNYRMESEAKCCFTGEEGRRNTRLGWDLECDGRKNSFQTELTVKEKDAETVLSAEGGFVHIKPGEGFTLALDELLMNVDGEELVKVKGDIGLSSFSGRIQQKVRPKRALFEVTGDEWDILGERLYREYGYLLEYMFGGW